MHYEHLIEVNDATVPEPVTNGQLWTGLRLRAENPVLFVTGLDHCRILERGADDSLERELFFGATRVRDRVLFTPQREVRYDIRDKHGLTGDCLRMTVEEPAPTRLFVRFAYDVRLADGVPEDSEEADLRRRIHQGVDLDTIVLIRRYALIGRLDD